MDKMLIHMSKVKQILQYLDSIHWHTEYPCSVLYADSSFIPKASASYQLKKKLTVLSI